MIIGANRYSQAGSTLRPPKIKTLRELAFAQSTILTKSYNYGTKKCKLQRVIYVRKQIRQNHKRR